MNKPVHVDLEAFARDIRASITAAPAPGTEFERLQLDGAEVTVQFGLFLARMDNASVEMDAQVDAACAVRSALVKNLAQDIDLPEFAAIKAVLEVVAAYSFRDAEIVSTTTRPETVGGNA